MSLTLDEANRMVQAAIAKAEAIDVKLSVAVCDTGGNLVAFNRMQGAIPVSATVAQGGRLGCRFAGPPVRHRDFGRAHAGRPRRGTHL